MGHLKGRYNPNPIIDTSEYRVEFVDGSWEEYATNFIAENIFVHVDDEGHEHLLLDEIVVHKTTDAALTMENCWISSSNGQQRMCPTTKGWQLLVRWKDVTSSWIALKDLTDLNPIKTAEYAAANGVSEQPAFAWWAKSILSKRRRILSKLNKTKYFCTTEKFGINIPRNVAEATRLDNENSNALWTDANQKEMKQDQR